jgi:beta-1,4-mannosyltransferase
MQVTPDFAAFHQYCSQLTSSLRALGLLIITEPAKSFARKSIASKAQIVHLHWLHSFSLSDQAQIGAMQVAWASLGLLWQLCYLQLAGVKICWTVHELTIPESNFPVVDHLMNIAMVRLSNTIIVHCNKAKSILLENYGQNSEGKVKVVPHGPFFSVQNSITQDEARTKLNLKKDQLVFLFFGVIRPYKGITEFVTQFLAHPNDAQLIIVGNPLVDRPIGKQYFENLCRQIEKADNITLIDRYIDDDEIELYMNCCDIAVFPYIDVLTSGAILMAMTFAKPCLVSNVGCIPETLDANGAFFYDVNVPGGLSKALSGCFNGKARLKEMGLHNRKRCADNTWTEIARLTQAAYQSAMTKTEPMIRSGDHGG